MASEVKTNKVSPATGTDVTLGDSSDTFTVPSGSAIVIASGGDINVQSSGEIDIASGATLDVNGTIDLTGATKTGFPGGLDNASQWRLTTDFTGDAAPIASNLEEVDLPVGFGILGSSMAESSGIFTFPATGYWLIRFHALYQAGVALGSLYNVTTIQTTTNNSTYAEASLSSAALHAANERGGATAEYIFDVTDTTQCKCRFDVDVEHSGCITKGDTAKNETFMTFVKLGDT